MHDDADDQLDEKSHGQSTAYGTADSTYARSDASSLASPSHSLPSPAHSLVLSPDSQSRGGSSPDKYFVLAEVEEANWRELSILPALAQDDGTLEGVSEEGEEGEFLGSVGSASSCGELSI